MDILNIPWQTIDAKLKSLGPGHHQAWLARELGVGTNVIANWRARGGAPLARAYDLSTALRCSADELLAPGKVATSNRAKKPSTQVVDSEGVLLQTYKALSPQSRTELLRFATYLLARDKDGA